VSINPAEDLKYCTGTDCKKGHVLYVQVLGVPGGMVYVNGTFLQSLLVALKTLPDRLIGHEAEVKHNSCLLSVIGSGSGLQKT
jgi:hypothetical protein